MQGIRLHKRDESHDLLLEIARTPGAYGSTNAIDWYVCTPNGLAGNIGLHTVEEHEDGTITVTPSILVSGGSASKTWHGYLTRGIWREA